MNKKILSIVVIFCTIISSYLMMQLNIKGYNKNKVYIDNNNDTSNKIIDKNKGISESEDVVKNRKDKSNNEDIKIKESKNIIIKNNEFPKDKVQENSDNKIYDNREASRDNEFNVENDDLKFKAKENNPQLFKVSTRDIRENLTLRDKQKLILLARKLSPFDYSRIKTDLYCEDQQKGVKDALVLARQRLSQEDYNNVKAILEKFINIELIEKES